VWNVVVQIVRESGIADRLILLRLGVLLLLRRCSLVLGTVKRCAVTITTALAAAPGIQHLHFVGDDFRAVPVLADLALPFARLQAAFDVDLAALTQILAGNFAQATEHDNAMPFGAFLHFAGLFVPPAIRRGDANIRDRRATSGVTRFRIGAEIANKYDFIYTT